MQSEKKTYRKLLLSFLKEQDTSQKITYVPDKDGVTPLFVSSYLGYVDFVEYFIVKCPGHIDVKDKEACKSGHTDVVKLLIDVGLNVNDTSNNGSTPLYLACQNGHYDTVKYLLDLNGQTLNNQNTTLKDEVGWSVLHVACSNGHSQVVKLLIDIGMNLNDTSNKGSTPLFLACRNGHYDTVNFLLDLNGQTLNSRVDTTLKDGNGCD
ncbi:serine/threonine-protein phosphatase 6 regulatory ankyrin repeat subunit B-like [Mytilus californianus]|uniref:serine/threonine-protein phosphatase 6 regulatory ankyrin repeat subunit B-like n=1 Tax=Mytilus californianus TaxID=6549 RepID=UPI002245C95D|nr:serine/threonine-protein phosphatase 6 regulatory ankyrin repeat subunit B-like [Mytilus californianus]